jgi:hypothetical protein
MKVMPPSMAACTSRVASRSVFGSPRCQPPSARIETGIPVRPNGRVGTSAVVDLAISPPTHVLTPVRQLSVSITLRAEERASTIKTGDGRVVASSLGPPQAPWTRSQHDCEQRPEKLHSNFFWILTMNSKLQRE